MKRHHFPTPHTHVKKNTGWIQDMSKTREIDRSRRKRSIKHSKHSKHQQECLVKERIRSEWRKNHKKGMPLR